MSDRVTVIAILLALGSATLTACGKKAPPAATQPDSTPTPHPVNPTGPKGGNTNTNPNTNTPADPSLPSPPQTPMFSVVNPQARDGSMNNLKQIALAFHNAEAAMGSFPIGIADKSGKLGLSSRRDIAVPGTGRSVPNVQAR
jgi:hypothetical protein